MDDAERLEPATVGEWSAWLRDHHEQPQGVWLVSPRRAADRAFSYEQAVLEALRYGWVDSTVKPVDELRSMQWFAPRGRLGRRLEPDRPGLGPLGQHDPAEDELLRRGRPRVPVLA